MSTKSGKSLPERAAEYQSRFRAYNERVEAHNAAHHWVDPPFADWLCECARTDCVQSVQLSIGEYESVRSEATRFLVAPSEEHVIADVERVVERFDRYWVVEKVGRAADLSEAFDTRAP